MAFKPFVAVLLTMSVLLFDEDIQAAPTNNAHSFQHFHGPVTGDVKEVAWKDKHGHEHHDYVAQPRYDFSYGVEDHHTGDYHGQKEQRDGKDVVGEYTIKEPDGNIRTVKYRAGKDGFFAQVVNSHGKNHGNNHDEEEEE